MHITIFYHYFIFGMFEANMIASGLGYRAKSEKEPEEYNSVRAVRCVDFSLGIAGDHAIMNWNMNASLWMKYYIQMRLIDRTLPRHIV